MKKLLSLSLAIVVSMVIASCAKNQPGGPAANDFFIRFKANGVQTEYRANAETIYNKPNGTTEHITTLGGTKEQFEPKKSNMTVALTTVGDNSLNVTFTNYATSAAGFKKAKLLQLAFFDANGKFFMSWSDDFASILPPGSPINCRLVLTEATSSYLKGNFSGTLFSQDYSTKLEITNGEFYLKMR
jgi:hypothetical protein